MRDFSLHIAESRSALTADACERITSIAREAIAARGVFHVALAGGSTPRALHELLAGSGADFSCWHVWFGDERHVPHEHADSNYRMAQESLIGPADLRPDHVHPFPTQLDPADAALAYENDLRAHLPPGQGATEGLPRFDLILLGMGEDGHTASLFPTDPRRHEQNKLVLAVEAPGVKHRRLTLTFPVLNAARSVLFLIAGAGKAEVLAQVLESSPTLPAGEVAPCDGELLYYVDADAAARVHPPNTG
jgi:6-phosphogluconolactonase